MTIPLLARSAPEFPAAAEVDSRLEGKNSPVSAWSSGWSDVGIEAIDALEEIGRRQDIEITLMSGIPDGVDAVEALCLGADAVAFGTSAIIAGGCIACMQRHIGPCVTGIAAQGPEQEQRYDPVFDVEHAREPFHPAHEGRRRVRFAGAGRARSGTMWWRCLKYGANTPWNRVRRARGRGTRAASCGPLTRPNGNPPRRRADRATPSPPPATRRAPVSSARCSLRPPGR